MRIFIFVIFIMMIIIFINELKNITYSFLKMNYIKDISDITIKKHCNDVYCEAETGRFNLAKNSYDLLLPNDVFNTKTYYFMILIVAIILYVNTFIQFAKYNSLYNQYIYDSDGTVFITYMQLFPYILGFITLLLIIGIIIRRYAPNETSGYKYYFNTDNDDINRYDETNINSILSIITKVLTFLILSYIICIYLSVIPDTPESIYKKANNYYYSIFGYLIFTFIFTYFLINIMNILLAFSINKYPKLDKIDFKKNIISAHDNIKLRISIANINDEYDNKNLLKSIYTFKRNEYTKLPDGHNDSATTTIHFWTQNGNIPKANRDSSKYWNFYKDNGEWNSIYDIQTKKFGAMVHLNSNSNEANVNDVHCIFYQDINYDTKVHVGYNSKIEDLTICPNFLTFLVPTLKNSLSEILTNEAKEKQFKDIHEDIRKYVETTIRSENLKIHLSVISEKYDEEYALNYFEIEDLMITYILKYFEDFINGETTLTGSATTFINYYNTDMFDGSESDKKNHRKNHMNILLNITIKLCENRINTWSKNEEDSTKKIYKDDSVLNAEYFKNTIYPDFLKQMALVKLVDNLINMKNKYNKKWSELVNANKTTIFKKNTEKLSSYTKINLSSYDEFNKGLKSINDGFIDEYKKCMNDYKNVLNNTESKTEFLFANDYKIFNDVIEMDNNFSVDLSYDTPNTFYEKYYNIVDGDYLSAEYKIGDYYVKNIQSLLIYILILIVVSLFVLALIVKSADYTQDIGNVFPNYWQFSYNIVVPLFILLIFVIYIYLFMSFNTDYNLNIVYGIFDSSYKRSLNSLNNIIIPYIKIHHDTTENITSNDYFDLYIITNVLASIINGNLEYNTKISTLDNNIDPLGLISTKDASPAKYQSYGDIVSIGKLFKPVSNTETVNLSEFQNYYNKIYEKLFDHFKDTPASTEEVAIQTAKDAIIINHIYKFIDDITYDITTTPFTSTTGDRPEYDEGQCNNIVSELMSGGDEKTYTNPINKYLYDIISKNHQTIYNIVIACKKIFNKNDFNNNVYNYNEQIKKGEYGVLKYFHFYNNSEEDIIPYKFILKLKKIDLDDFYKAAGITGTDGNIAKEKLQDENKPNIQNIIGNFLMTTTHIKYNYNLIKKDPSLEIMDIIKSDLPINRDTYNYINSLNFFHSYKNKKLFSLFSNTSYANSNKIAEIDDTFKYTFASEKYSAYEKDICPAFKTQKYIYNLLMNDYDVRALNISNNYLKNIIRTIYYQINNKDMLVDNYGEQKITGGTGTGESFEIYKDKSTNADAVNIILHKANRCVSVNLMGNYIANIILIAIVYNIGYGV
jgi:hypothetical protein